MLPGFADLHNHQFANLAFGGRGFFGQPYGEIGQVLGDCAAEHGALGVKDRLGIIYSVSRNETPLKRWKSSLPELLFSVLDGKLKVVHRTNGFPHFRSWPQWDDATHQSVFEEWLYRAVQGGLRLMVMHAFNNEWAARVVGPRPGWTGLDMEAVDRQLDAAYAMQGYLDQRCGGDGAGWYRIVRTPAEARDAIAANKLAVVLGIEVDFLFDSRLSNRPLPPDVARAKLDAYYARGVRHLFPIHFANNQFGGVAYSKPLQVDPNLGESTIGLYEVETEEGAHFGYTYRGGRRNTLGLTELGKVLIRAAMARGMLIDVDHMSARARDDALTIAEEENCPVVSSHSSFMDVSEGEGIHEGFLRASDVERIKRLGGMVAPLLHQGGSPKMKKFVAPRQPSIEPRRPETSETWVQAYRYAVEKMEGQPVATGSDSNGFAMEPGPRFAGRDPLNRLGRLLGLEHFPWDPQGGRVTYPFTALAPGVNPLDRTTGNSSSGLSRRSSSRSLFSFFAPFFLFSLWIVWIGGQLPPVSRLHPGR